MDAKIKTLTLFGMLLFGLLGCDSQNTSKQELSKTVSMEQSSIPFQEKRPNFMLQHPDVELVGSCNMETLDGKPWGAPTLTSSDKKNIPITGWVFDKKQEAIADSIYIMFYRPSDKQEYYAAAHRTDSLIHIDDKDRPASYSARVDASMLPVGEYESLIVAEVKTHTLLCANGRKILL